MKAVSAEARVLVTPNGRTEAGTTKPEQGEFRRGGTQRNASNAEDKSKMNITQEQIATRAYAIYQSRGCQPGREMEDWLQAEAEIRREMGHTAPATPKTSAQQPAIQTAVEQSLARVSSFVARPASYRRRKVTKVRAA
jgi:hypothetical protein